MTNKTLFLALMSLFTTNLFANSYSGRFSVGTNIATETFNYGHNEDQNNDHMEIFSRLYHRAYDFGKDKKSEFITELKGNYDFYGTLDQENRTLKEKSTPQLRQLAYKAKITNKFSMTTGRFPIKETSQYVDGMQLTRKLTKATTLALWGGLNPEEDSTLPFKLQTDSTLAGVYFSHHPNNEYGETHLYTTNGIAVEKYQVQTDRVHLHHNLLYLWRGGRLFSFFNLDFVPNIYLQRGNLTYYQTIQKQFAIHLKLQSFEAIKYYRVKDIRENLSSSPYKEASAKFIWKTSSKIKISHQFSHGKREEDGLERSQVILGIRTTNVLSKGLSTFFQAGHTKNFTNKNLFLQYEFSKYSKEWEVIFGQNYSQEEYYDGKTLKPMTTTLSLVHFFNTKYFATLAFEHAIDEDVQISTLLFKFLYRFGSSPPPPIREGESPKGKI